MDSEFSHSSLVIGGIAIQVLILALVGLFLFYRRFNRSSKSESRIKAFLVQNTRRTSIFGGILMGAIFLGLSIYFVGTLDRSGQHKPTSPIAKRSFSPQPEPSPHEKKDPFEHALPETAKPSRNCEMKYGDSRMRESTGKTIQGELPDFAPITISARDFPKLTGGGDDGEGRGCLRDIPRKPMISHSAAETLEEMNRTLLAECTVSGDHPGKGHARTINDLFKQEKICLLAFPIRPS